jgi:hypothetical protein
MKKVLLGIVIGAFAFHAYQRVTEPASASTHSVDPDVTPVERPEAAQVETNADGSSFRCDGRTLCSQMRSCEEATYFVRHCPNVRMDGNNDGVPCEKQWCRN